MTDWTDTFSTSLREPRTKHDGDSRVCQIGIDPYTGAVLSLEWTDGVG